MQILKGHVSPETAYVVGDYPYGFRLRCKIRYWLEYHPKRGVRMCSQTTDPRRDNEFWNKPKCSTYADISGAMYLDEDNHVDWGGLSIYSNAKEAEAWYAKFNEGVPDVARSKVETWIKLKQLYEAKRDEAQEVTT